VGAASFLALLRLHGAPSAALAAHAAPSSRRKSPTSEGLEGARRWLDAGGLLLHPGAGAYPERLLDLREPPPVLFVDGSPEALALPAVALVGGRQAGSGALAAAREAGRLCAARGLAVVSGGARGIDGAALEGALDAGGTAVVVLGCGIDVVYPPEHGALFRRCVARGALVSELLPGAPPRGSFFVTRNRILAALAGPTALLWGDARSGALTTTRWAARLGRPCAALEQAGGEASEASRAARRQGATLLAGVEAFEAWLAALRGR
jgi:DNA processing protein